MMKGTTAIDIYDEMPRAMRRYLSHYGWHFNKPMCNYATSLMRKNNMPIRIRTREEVDKLLNDYSIDLENNIGYDYVFVCNMGVADYLGSSIEDDRHLALYVKDTIDDEDAGNGTTMRRWYATMVSNGVMVDWNDFI